MDSNEAKHLKEEKFSCLMCNAQTRKYKCSRCLEFSCSYACYKDHKVNFLCLEQRCDETSNAELADEPEPTQHEFKSYDTIPPAILEKLKKTEDLKHLLYNPHLRNLLRQLDTDPHPWRAMQNAMQEPIFIEFADECLKVVESAKSE